MPASPTPFWRRPLPGSRALRERETDPTAIDLARMRWERDMHNFNELLCAQLLGSFLAFLVPITMVAPLTGGTLADLTSLLAGATAPIALGAGLGAAVPLIIMPYINRRTWDRGSFPVYKSPPPRPQRSPRTIALATTATLSLGAAIALPTAALLAPDREAALSNLALTTLGCGAIAVMLGAPLLSSGLLWRRGDDLVCAKCAYAQGAGPAIPPACPECGNPWNDRWRTRMGRRTRSPALIAAGALTLAAGTLLLAATPWIFSLA